MPTIFYLQAATTPTVRTLPAGAFGAWDNTNSATFGGNIVYLGQSFGAGQVDTSFSVTLGSLATSAFGVVQLASDALGGQTIAADNWALGFAAKLPQASATKKYQGYAGLYVVNGATGALRGVIFDLTGIGSGSRSATGELTCYAGSVAGASVTVQDGDYLVLECGVQTVSTAIGATPIAPHVYSDGMTAIAADNASTADAQSFLQAPATLTFSSQPPAGGFSATGQVTPGMSGSLPATPWPPRYPNWSFAALVVPPTLFPAVPTWFGPEMPEPPPVVRRVPEWQYARPLEPSLFLTPPALSWKPTFEPPPYPRRQWQHPQPDLYVEPLEQSLWTVPPPLSWAPTFPQAWKPPLYVTPPCAEAGPRLNFTVETLTVDKWFTVPIQAGKPSVYVERPAFQTEPRVLSVGLSFLPGLPTTQPPRRFPPQDRPFTWREDPLLVNLAWQPGLPWVLPSPLTPPGRANLSYFVEPVWVLPGQTSDVWHYAPLPEPQNVTRPGPGVPPPYFAQALEPSLWTKPPPLSWQPTFPQALWNVPRPVAIQPFVAFVHPFVPPSWLAQQPSLPPPLPPRVQGSFTALVDVSPEVSFGWMIRPADVPARRPFGNPALDAGLFGSRAAVPTPFSWMVQLPQTSYTPPRPIQPPPPFLPTPPAADWILSQVQAGYRPLRGDLSFGALVYVTPLSWMAAPSLPPAPRRPGSPPDGPAFIHPVYQNASWLVMQPLPPAPPAVRQPGSFATPVPWGGTESPQTPAPPGPSVPEQDISVWRATAANLNLTALSPTGLAGWSMTFMVKKNYADANGSALIAKSVGSGITVTDAVNGLFTVALSATDTTIPIGDYWWSVNRTDSGFESVLAWGEFHLLANEQVP